MRDRRDCVDEIFRRGNESTSPRSRSEFRVAYNAYAYELCYLMSSLALYRLRNSRRVTRRWLCRICIRRRWRGTNRETHEEFTVILHCSRNRSTDRPRVFHEENRGTADVLRGSPASNNSAIRLCNAKRFLEARFKK